MNRVGLLKIAGACAVLYAAGLVAVIAVLGNTGLLEAAKASDVLPLMVQHRTTAIIGLWLFVVLPVWLAVAGLGCLAALRSSGYVTWVAALTFITGDIVGGVLVGGIGVPLFSAAMLRSKLAPRWVAWLGFAVAITGGWGTLLLPVGGVFAIVPFIGVPLFVAWMVALGIGLWRAPEPEIS